MLDEYSSKQQTLLAALRPDWLSYFSEYPYEESGESYLLVKIPSVGNPADELFVYTYDEEVTIAFGIWERHFSEYEYADGGEMAAAVAEIEKIQKDELVVVSFWNGGEWLGSRTVNPAEPLATPDFASGARSAKVISWSGSLSRDVAL
jgi:hypothetical protein